MGTEFAMKILLDTDIGSDIDDAVCLAYLLANPACHLLGITTVTGQAEQRARIAASICDAAGRRIPIHPGAEIPLLAEQKQPEAHQAAALPAAYRGLQFSRGEAIVFLRETIRRHPGEVTLLAVGPLTNVALLFLVDPEIPELLERLVLMCGAFDEPVAREEGIRGGIRAEWNAAGDPHATAIVYRQSVPVHRTIGLNVTERVTMNGDDARSRFQLPLLESVLPYAGIWLASQPKITFHDPLAAATIFDEGICRFEKGEVAVELENPALRGATRWRGPAADGRHEIAAAVDPERFFQHFFGAFEALNPTA